MVRCRLPCQTSGLGLCHAHHVLFMDFDQSMDLFTTEQENRLLCFPLELSGLSFINLVDEVFIKCLFLAEHMITTVINILLPHSPPKHIQPMLPPGVQQRYYKLRQAVTWLVGATDKHT